MARSRLNRQLQEKSLHTIALSVGGSILIILLLIFFGAPALTKLGSLLMSRKDSQVSSADSNTAFIAPPTLDPLYTATNSATITVSGSSTNKLIIRLYNNDTFIDEVAAKDDGSFIFHDIKLKEGDNAFKVVARTSDKKQSKDSPTSHVLFTNKEPTLSIDFPSDNSNFKDNKMITVKGKTDVNAEVTVNGFQAIMDSNGGYSYLLSLHDGGNEITVVTTDEAGNKKQQTIHVSFN